MKKWNLLLVLALLFVACKDEYDVNLDELYGTTSPCWSAYGSYGIPWR